MPAMQQIPALQMPDAAYARKIQQEESAAQRAAAHQLRSDEEIARALQAELDKEERAPRAPTAPLKANGIKRTKAPAPAANESDSSEDLPAKKSRRILESDEDSDPRPRKKLI